MPCSTFKRADLEPCLFIYFLTGMNQAGLAECIVRAVNSCHPYLHSVLYERWFHQVAYHKF